MYPLGFVENKIKTVTDRRYTMAAGIDNERFLERAKQAFNSSTSYFDVNFRKNIDNSYRHYRNRHASGSKYYSNKYKYLSKNFVPKTRAMVRQMEAKAMQAFFSNQDVVSVDPLSENNAEQAISALINKELLEYRLTHTIPWFKLCMGGIQDAEITGAICSYQHWIYETKTEAVVEQDADGNPIINDEGEPIITKREKILRDQPVIDLRPIENIRFSPSASWLDPINTSPYLIDMLPMHVYEIEAKMEEIDSKTGAAKWKKYSREEITASTKKANDLTESARSGGAEDRYDTVHGVELKDYDIAWVHRNFMIWRGADYVFYTLGTQYLLTDPVPIEKIYWHGERPYVLGTGMIESHRPIPDSPVHLVAGLQREVNEISNQRRDNVKLVLAKRFFARRGSQIDMRNLLSGAPGSVTMMNDTNADVRTVDFQDVTGSSFAEHDRINMSFDELSGSFSTSSVAANRNLNETVGGMSMLRAGGSEMAEYFIRTIAETWIEPLMRQLVKLEQSYETDETIMAIAADKAQIYERYGVNAQLDSFLKHELTTTVNMGLDATDPLRKVNKLIFTISKLAEILQNPVPGLKKEEVIKEVFGNLGYKDGSRFYQEGGDPQLQAMQQQMEQAMQQAQQQIQMLQQQLNDKQQDRELKAMLAQQEMQLRASIDQGRAALENTKTQISAQSAEQDRIATLSAKHAEIIARKEIEDAKIRSNLLGLKMQEHGDTQRQGAVIAKDIMLETMRQGRTNGRTQTTKTALPEVYIGG
jgi:hypothetical protein